jgi:hypothetical protein
MNATPKKRLKSLPRREAAFIEPIECALVRTCRMVHDGFTWVDG